ncbi:MAG TPA: hypothetical protein PKD00_01890 [Burkholderiales bacterium]|nr:hypothetical protein [Burkholderiales bacterium]
MNNNYLITIRSMPDKSVGEYMVTRLNDWENKAPAAIHTIGPSLNKNTGMFNIDFAWLDYELLGISLVKEDNPQLHAFKTNLSNYRQQNILNIQTELGEVGLKKIETDSDIQRKQIEIAEITKEIDEVEKKLESEKSKDKPGEANLSKLKTSLETLIDKKTKYLLFIDELNNKLQEYKLKENKLHSKLNDDDDIYVANLKKEIKLLEEKNRKSENELQLELAKKIGAETLDPRPENIVWSKLVKSLKVDNNDIVLDRKNAIQALQLCMLMGNNIVALSKRFEDVHNPRLIKTQYYIHNEEKETEVKLVSFDTKKEAYKLCDLLSPYAKKDILQIKGISTWNMSDNIITSKISDMVENNPEEFLSLARLENDERERRSFVSELVNYRIINKGKDGAYYGQDESDLLAHNIENLMSHIYSPNNKLKLQWFTDELKTRKSKSLNTTY